ncbi:MAG: MgtC/SapB family protein [Turicibacter sp.]|nr:MgtC/SapB family protein [Turicibacter sp.]
MSVWDVLLRVILATLMSGVIGYEREHKNRPAGVKTHILVCLGAASFAILERLLVVEMMGMEEGAVTFNFGRLVAQVISGIGFLGAGTIVITKHNIQGLTTAASVWIVACLGIVIGYGVYILALPLFLTIMVTLVILKKFIRIGTVKKMEIKYRHRIETKEFLADYFQERNIIIKDLDFSVEMTEAGNIYTEVYTIDLLHEISYLSIIDDLSRYNNVLLIRCITV